MSLYNYFFFNKNFFLFINKNYFNYTSLFTVFFLKKEVFYTKLKYSRVPQFDTSSGALASLLSGFYGFLVCEKYGLELIDSGDFLLIYIYILLLFFSVILLFKHINGFFFFNNFISN